MKYGYMRVSTDKATQKFDRQLDQLKEVGCSKVYADRISGRCNDKPQFEQLVADLSKSEDEDKEIVVVSIDRLGRSTTQVLNTIQRLDNLGIGLTSLKEGFAAHTPQGQFFITIVAAFAQLEAEMTADRVKQGLAAAKKRGKTLGRPKVDKDVMDTAIRMWQSGDYTVKEICSISRISKGTLYNEINRRGITRD